jgi:hypothetical protein
VYAGIWPGQGGGIWPGPAELGANWESKPQLPQRV